MPRRSLNLSLNLGRSPVNDETNDEKTLELSRD